MGAPFFACLRGGKSLAAQWYHFFLLLGRVPLQSQPTNNGCPFFPVATGHLRKANCGQPGDFGTALYPTALKATVRSALLALEATLGARQTGQKLELAARSGCCARANRRVGICVEFVSRVDSYWGPIVYTLASVPGVRFAQA